MSVESPLFIGLFQIQVQHTTIFGQFFNEWKLHVTSNTKGLHGLCSLGGK